MHDSQKIQQTSTILKLISLFSNNLNIQYLKEAVTFYYFLNISPLVHKGEYTIKLCRIQSIEIAYKYD